MSRTVSCIRAIATSSWLNVLLVVVPVAITSYLVKAPPLVVFATNVVAIVPLSSLLTYATEALSKESGDTIGALMNITFGNLAEIVLLAGLYHDQFEVVQASILGSILVNLLFILGTAILAGSYYNHGQGHDSEEAQGLACLLSVSVFSLLIPNAFYHSFNDDKAAAAAVLILSRVSSLTLLAIYILYIFFQIRKRTSFSLNGGGLAPALTLPRSIRFQDEDQDHGGVEDDGRRADSLEMGSVSESDSGLRDNVYNNETLLSLDNKDGEEYLENNNSNSNSNTATGQDSKKFVSNAAPFQSIYHYNSRYRSRSRDSFGWNRSQDPDSRHLSFVSSTSNLPRFLLGNNNSNTHATNIDMSGHANNDSLYSDSEHSIGRVASICLLITSSLLVAVCAEFLVSTLDETISSGPLSQTFIGLIILPIAGNCAELLTAITVAARGNFDLAIGVSVGSSVQISLFVTPLVVLAGWVMGKEMTLYFGVFEIVALFATTFLVNCLILNSRTNALEGSILCACYFIMAVGAFLFPTPDNFAQPIGGGGDS
ncbi:hypothetical protein DV735_g3184, partial [Chaetothyriales sp. CBS 134920]